MLYTYKHSENFMYHDVCIACLGDTLDIVGNEVRNISVQKRTHRLTKDLIDSLISRCTLIDGSDIDFIETGNEDLDYIDNLKQIIELNSDTIIKLIKLGILKTKTDSCRNYNVGSSNYAKHVIQPWTIWQEYNLNAWDADIVKRILRTKTVEGKSETDSRIEDYEKIVHICQERLRQLRS